MTARELRTARIRRDRREARERAYREWVCGGPLVEVDRPIIGGDDFTHPLLVQAEIQRRALRIRAESMVLALHFASRCCATAPVRLAMLGEWIGYEQIAKRGPGTIATHTTHPSLPQTNRTIPALPRTHAREW
jgi:hypothetical protein